jgi:hypothetical protein
MNIEKPWLGRCITQVSSVCASITSALEGGSRAELFRLLPGRPTGAPGFLESWHIAAVYYRPRVRSVSVCKITVATDCWDR